MLYNTRKRSEDSIAANYLIALSGLFSPNLIDQSSCMILTTHARTRPILHDVWSIRLGENRLYRSWHTFGGYASEGAFIVGGCVGKFVLCIA